MSIRPEVRYLIPCWKEPTYVNQRPSALEILYAVKPTAGTSYPVWQRPFFIFVLITNLHGSCKFHIELHREELEQETVVQRSDVFNLDFVNDPLHVQPLSIMMKATELEDPGVYHVCLVWNDEILAKATFHGR